MKRQWNILCFLLVFAIAPLTSNANKRERRRDTEKMERKCRKEKCYVYKFIKVIGVAFEG